MVGLALLLAGVTLTVAGSLSGLTVGGSVLFPPVLVAGGVSLTSVGAWLWSHPNAIVIDRTEAVIRLRDPIREPRISFDEVAHIEVQPGPLALALTGMAPLPEPRYDVALCFREGVRLTTHAGLKLPSA